MVLKLFPGLNEKITSSLINTKGIKAIIIETFGAGNATTQEWFVNELKSAIAKGIVILNVTQCHEGRVVQGMYETSSQLKRIGVVSGHDITYESAVAKLMFLLGQKLPVKKLKNLLEKNLRGELTE